MLFKFIYLFIYITDFTHIHHIYIYMSSIFGPVVAPYFSLKLSQAHDTHDELFSLVRHKNGGCKLQDVLKDGVGGFPKKGLPGVIQN